MPKWKYGSTVEFIIFRVTDETLRCNFISCRCHLGGAIAIVEMSVRNRCHLNIVSGNLPTALGGGPTSGALTLLSCFDTETVRKTPKL